MGVNLGNIIAGLYEPYDYDDITVDNTAGGVGLTAAKLRPIPGSDGALKECKRVIMTVETAAMRYTYDGTAPTTSLGHLVNAGDIIVLLGQPSLDNFRAIRTGGTSADLRVTYER